MKNEFFPYTKAEAVKIARRYFGGTVKAARDYIEGMADFNYKYSRDYLEYLEKNRQCIAEMERGLKMQSHGAFYED